MIFDYPSETVRIHGPEGYSVYESYRPWLRDEFRFRCVYCLKREMWGQVTGEFELDHFEPQSLRPELALDYDNLVYACRRCNLMKLDRSVVDPMEFLQTGVVTVLPDGELICEQVESKRLIMQLDLNSPRLKQWRVMWLRIVELAKERDKELYLQLTGFPTDLPNLATLKPPRNTRLDGVEMSWYARREREQHLDSY